MSAVRRRLLGGCAAWLLWDISAQRSFCFPCEPGSLFPTHLTGDAGRYPTSGQDPTPRSRVTRASFRCEMRAALFFKLSPKGMDAILVRNSKFANERLEGEGETWAHAPC